MITDNENDWHYLAMKSLPGLLRNITSTNHGDFYCLNCFHSDRTLNALKNHEKLYENHDYCNVKMPNGDNKYISSTLGKNSLRVPVVVYDDFECLLVKIDSCEKNPNTSYTEKKDKHIPFGYSITTSYSYGKSVNKTKYYRGLDCVQKFSQDLKKILNNRIYFEERPMLPLTDNEKVYMIMKNSVIYVKKEFSTEKKVRNTKINAKSGIIVILQVNIVVLLIVYAI